MKKALISCLILFLPAVLPARQADYSHTIQAEKLDRGVVAVKTDKGVFISWRSLVTDPKGSAFDIYRGPVKLNTCPIADRTNFSDPDGFAGAKYSVRTIVNGNETEVSDEVTVWDECFMRVHLDRPQGGTVPPGGPKEQRDFTYTPDDVSVGDVDGDGQWELIVKWLPTNQADNGQRRHTGKTYLDCYKLDGRKLWRIDLGHNIRSGNHYTQFMVYDFDLDGKAELICKTAPGTIDGLGKPVLLGNDRVTDDYRTMDGDNTGMIDDGPEYLSVFNGESGAEIHTIHYNPPRSINDNWGDKRANRQDRFLACVAYLDGRKPSAVFFRGYYTAAYAWAVDFDGQKLHERWMSAFTEKGPKSLYGEGAHSVTVGDVDGDGCDEIVFGAACLDHDGSCLYATEAGHGDALHLGDFDPDREGLEVFMVHEEESPEYKYDSEFRDARTGEIIWSTPQSGHDIGRGLAANVSAKFRGYEVWPVAFYTHSDDDNALSPRIFTCKGEVAAYNSAPSTNFRIYWDGDLLDELFDGHFSRRDRRSSPAVTKPNADLDGIEQVWQLGQYSNASSANHTKATPNLQADLFGDWREEIILHDQSTQSDLLIFTTTIPTDYRVNSLMQDRQYRLAIAWQNVAYNQPPHLSYNLEEAFSKTSGQEDTGKQTGLIAE